MKLSTRSRYGLRFLVELAAHNKTGPVFLREISEKQKISEKYLSKLVIPLKGAKIISSIRGTGGGYFLARPPEKITLREIVEVLEGDIDPVACVGDKDVCSSAAECVTREIWCGLGKQIHDYLESLTLGTVVEKYLEHNKNKDPFNYHI